MKTAKKNPILFRPRSFVVTMGIFDLLAKHDLDLNEEVTKLINRHVRGEWGDVCEEDAKTNDNAVEYDNQRVMSVFDVEGTKVWLITEWDRSVCTILLPDEY